ncbi:MAG: toll/interleukin-1 receptor domain-containing protein, partial [Egibacteraceae bacterium]
MVGEGPDFFVSYTQADRAWAEWIAWQLDEAGQRVVLQAWDVGPGSDWVHEMHAATATARRTIAVLSQSYLQSVHGEAEWSCPVKWCRRKPSVSSLLSAMRLRTVVGRVPPLGRVCRFGSA